ncbi:MAG: UDP-N-acetylmuramoyl-tripeptide--D-alanyl-D-alanine ligase [Acidobacteria bacterium]|nr:UDP-N-acetylmuramoyl-tripeptide--D-alanyl-D-alanine ligase [Acidobacteriota bacterium]
MKLREAIEKMAGRSAHLDPALAESDVTRFVIDSREAGAGSVFFALSQPEYKNNGFNGDFADSTEYVPAALSAGAVAAVVREERFAEYSEALEGFSGQLIFSDDVIASLQSLAHQVYLEWNRPVVAITGSAGKTTAKELTAHVLSAAGLRVLRNKKNYNNGLGHPLTVLELPADSSYQMAVLEMGMSTPLNEIERLCRITPPDVSVVLNVMPVHIEHLGTIEGIAAAKAEIVEGMKEGGTAVLNADDERVAAMAALSKGHVITFGIANEADIRAEEIEFSGFGNTQFKLITPAGEAQVAFPLNGKHNVMNALAAAAVGHIYGMGPADIAGAFATVSAPGQRGEIIEYKAGFRVINDSYNSNPDALVSMAETLVAGSRQEERKIVVAGEMLELGTGAVEMHRDAGQRIGALGVDVLIGVRGLAEHIVAGAELVGINNARFAADSEAAGEMLAEMITAGDVVLVKGSRGVKTERVIEKLDERFERS